MLYKCILCKKSYRELNTTVYTCSDCNNINTPTTEVLDLIKDDRTDWVQCKDCKKLLNYTKKSAFEQVESS